MNLGFMGGILVTDTTAITGTFRVMHVLADAAFTTLTTDITLNGATEPAAASDFGTLTAGEKIYGLITAVTLASGKVILYK